VRPAVIGSCRNDHRERLLGLLDAQAAMRDGPEAGLAHIDAVLDRGGLADYYLPQSARADMCRRPGRTGEARSFANALALTQQGPKRQFLQERIQEPEQKTSTTCRIPVGPFDYMVKGATGAPEGVFRVIRYAKNLPVAR
jgi:hypothetical protein